jgi:4-hydroxybenzoate polyprenyltransferase
VVIVDVMSVAAGFILRAWAGALVLHVALSRWLVLCTGLLALFLGFVKRRQELIARDLDGGEGRAILREYSADFLDQMISVVTASTVVAYSLYAFDPEVARKLGTEHLGLTVPFVLFGIFRYLYLVHRRGQGGKPHPPPPGRPAAPDQPGPVGGDGGGRPVRVEVGDTAFP